MPVARAGHLYPVANLFLGYVACRVSRAHGAGKILCVGVYRNDSDADTQREVLALPAEAEVDNGRLQVFGNTDGFCQRTVCQQYAELVSTQSAERVALAYRSQQQLSTLLLQFIALSVSAGIGDALDAV